MGFDKSSHVRETQLVTFVNNLLETMNNAIETDMMDLSKVFDTASHRRL